MNSLNEESDIYSGFTKNSTDFYGFNANEDEAFKNALKVSSYGKKNATPKFPRGDTASSLLESSEKPLARPSTAIRPVGYSSEAGYMFDPLLHQRSASKKTITLEQKKADSPEEKYKILENKIVLVLEQSILMSTGRTPDLTGGLKKAKEATALDETLKHLREQNGDNTYHNYYLSFSVLFNLANLYCKNEMYVEALNHYNLMIKNKLFDNVNRLKVNMGNIYFQLGLYPKAIKMYRMALDQVPNNQKELRLKITHNIAILFIKMGQYSDAAASFEFIMSEKADLKSGLHLILCYYAIGDVEKMKRAFQLLLEVQIDFDDEHKMASAIASPAQQYILELIKGDSLYQYESERKRLAEKNILMSSNLISGVIEEEFNDGYTWCVEVIKNSNYPSLANDLELNKAIMFLKQHDTSQAIETLKYYEKKDSAIASNAVINLLFIYMQMKDLTNATRYAQICRDIDSYNPGTFINGGACEMLKNDLDMAKAFFEAAIEIDATSFEAIYNLGLVYKRTGEYETALTYFQKLHSSTIGHVHHPHIIYQMGNLYELMGDTSGALEWYMQLMGTIHMDPSIFLKISEMSEVDGDQQQAFQYRNESHRINPTNFAVIAWIGSYFIELQVAEKSVAYYERAVLANPNDPYFLIRIAGCYRRIGNTNKSIQLFQNINDRFPDNIDCLRALMHLTQNQDMELYEKYAAEFHRLEKLKETRQRIGSSRPSTRGRIKRTNSKASFGSGSDNLNSSSSTYGASSAKLETAEITYADPLGPPAERPKTGKSRAVEESDDDFDADELLPA